MATSEIIGGAGDCSGGEERGEVTEIWRRRVKEVGREEKEKKVEY